MAPGADGGGGAREAAQRMRDRAKRMRDHSPALKVFGQAIDKLTSDGFRGQKELDGERFAPLAPSTIEARIRAKGGSKRTGRGTLTKGASKKRAAMSAPGGMQILQITGLQKNSARTTVTAKNTATWSAIGRLLPHMTGSASPEGRPPKRNPTVFDVGRDGKAKLKPRVAKMLREYLTNYIETGKVAS